MPWVIKKGKGPVEKCLCFHPNNGWVWPLFDGWEMVYFYRSRKTAETAMGGRMMYEFKRISQEIEVVQVKVFAREVE